VPDGSCESNLRLNDTHDMHFRLARPIRSNVIGYSLTGFKNKLTKAFIRRLSSTSAMLLAIGM